MDEPAAASGTDALFIAARKGDAAALEELCGAMRPRLYRAAWALLKDRDEADDIAQEALVRAVSKRFTFLGRGSAEGWMIKIAVNLAKNRLRDRKRRREITEGASHEALRARGALADGPASPDAGVDRAKERARLDRALATLSARQREIVELRVGGELSFAEVGRALGIKEANARVTFHQARQRLAAALERAPDEATS